MKVKSVLALVTLVLASCSLDYATAAECTPEQAESAADKFNPIFTDANCLDMKPTTKGCGNDKCIALIKTVVSQLPDCSVNGMKFKAELEKLLKQCPSSSATTYAVSASVAAASTAVAVAVAFL